MALVLPHESPLLLGFPFMVLTMLHNHKWCFCLFVVCKLPKGRGHARFLSPNIYPASMEYRKEDGSQNMRLGVREILLYDICRTA
jgi:hypothetical protein